MSNKERVINDLSQVLLSLKKQIEQLEIPTLQVKNRSKENMMLHDKGYWGLCEKKTIKTLKNWENWKNINN